MKSIRLLLLSTALLAPGLLHAQSAVPNLISYQGIVSDGTDLIGANEPVNREVYFRIYDTASGNNVIYSEKQIVTIWKGEFSVLIGAGSAIAGEETTGRGEVDIATVFNGNQRFLGITVDSIGDGMTNDSEISPRQQIVTTAFAFRAREAEMVLNSSIGTDAISDGSVTLADLAQGAVNSNTIVDASISTADLGIGVVTSAKIAANAVTNASIANGSVTTEKIAANAVNSASIANNAVTGGKIADGTITGADIASNIAVWALNSGYAYWNAGRVGVGTTTPGYPLEVVGSANYSTNIAAYLIGTTTTIQSATPLFPAKTFAVSVSASNYFKGAGFVAVSDERIKEVFGQSDSEEDLSLIARLRVTDYGYVDKIAQGTRSEKKVIAQQVEEIYPQAVSRSVGVVPDIYQRATVANGWIDLVTDLKIGDRVRLMTDDATAVHEVLEVEPGRFRTNLDGDGRVFVYGREVDDFRTVDYDAIAMLNVSATQELHRRLIESEREVESLRGQVAQLEARDRARESRLTAIESMLRAPGESSPQTVSAR